MPSFVQVLLIRHWSALKLQLQPVLERLHPWIQIGLFLSHILGWLAIVQLSHNAQWWGLLPILALLPILIYLKTRNAYAWLESLAPMVGVYGVLIMRLLLAVIYRLQDQEFILEPPFYNVLNINTWVWISLMWTLACQVGLASHFFLKHPLDFKLSIKLFSGILLVGTFIWTIGTYFTIRTHGVTASDPYAYTQMGYDLAETDSVEHEFPLARLTYELDIAASAVVPIGYRMPDTETYQSATVWSPGYAPFLAIAYSGLGEIGFYLSTPVFGILSLAVLAWLSYLLLPNVVSPYQELVIAISVLVLATSLLQISWLAVPMADIPAQLFSMLAIVFVLRMRHSKIKIPTQQSDLINGFLAGLCLGTAFAIRYTQVLMAVPMLYGFFLIFWQERQVRRRGLQTLLATGVGAWLVAGIVFWYHNTAFGHPLAVGSEELGHFSLDNLSLTMPRVWNDLFTRDEFRWLAPFLVWGLFRLMQKYRHVALVLGLWFGVLLAFHLPYHYLKLRDLLSVFPVLAFIVGFGVADIVKTICEIKTDQLRGWLLAGLIASSLVFFVLRLHTTPYLSKNGFTNFGYLNAEQRTSFDKLADATPENAIIGVSLNSGAVILHSDRSIVRPYEWSTDDWFEFIDRAQADNHVIYLLVESVDMEPILEATLQRYDVEPVIALQMPYFHFAGGSVNETVILYIIGNMRQAE